MKEILVMVIIAMLAVVGCIFGVEYKCSHNENYIHYGDDDYCFVDVHVGSGRSKNIYSGTITVDDYNKWCNGEEGTVFVYSTTREGYGSRIRIDNVTTISNYGSEPDWLPMNFWY